MNAADRERGGGLVEPTRERELEMELAVGSRRAPRELLVPRAFGPWI